MFKGWASLCVSNFLRLVVINYIHNTVLRDCRYEIIFITMWNMCLKNIVFNYKKNIKVIFKNIIKVLFKNKTLSTFLFFIFFWTWKICRILKHIESQYMYSSQFHNFNDIFWETKMFWRNPMRNISRKKYLSSRFTRNKICL